MDGLAYSIVGDIGLEIAEALVARGEFERNQLDRALQAILGSGQRIGPALIALGVVSETALAQAYLEELRVAQVSADDFPQAALLPDQLSGRFLRRAHAVPVSAGDSAMVLAMVDPTDDQAVNAAELATGLRVERCVALASEIARALDRLYPNAADGNVVRDTRSERDDVVWEDQRKLRDQVSDEPVIQLVNQIIKNAVDARASDIHIEALDGRLAVRNRIDGVLREEPSPPVSLRDAIVSRIKIGARLNIGERRLPQDGRMRVSVHGRNFDLRVATMPSVHGESIVIRLLESSRGPVGLDDLGFGPSLQSDLTDILRRPNGIVLATGPTGSGKTTTLYGCLNHLNSRTRKILTVEDPVEYEIPGVTQVAVASDIGMTFARALRGFLRFDPDVMLVGEIRDRETAEVAVEMALTGRLVLSSLHTNDAPGAVTRLLDMGVESFLLTSTLRAVVAQRLVRTLCAECRAPDPTALSVLRHLEETYAYAAEPGMICRAAGCPRCHGTGYSGRTPIAEIFQMSDPVRRSILDRTDSKTVRGAALAEGMRPMLFDGLDKACTGITTVDEVLRVVRDSQG